MSVIGIGVRLVRVVLNLSITKICTWFLALFVYGNVGFIKLHGYNIGIKKHSIFDNMLEKLIT